MNIITYKELLNDKNYILVDVRSPLEFLAEGIPHAINIPLLLDHERVEVGTTYKQISVEDAKKIGINYVSKRLPEIFTEVLGLSKKNKKIVFYCARGGMRSSSVVALFSSMGFKVAKLDGGYRKYREYINIEIPRLNTGIKYIIIHGRTGVGKTKLLNSLEKKGYSVLDLEKFANHKGSFFGALCEKKPQSQKKFESELYEFFKNNKADYVIAESESKRIGNVYLPECVYNSLLSGEHIFVHTSMEQRIKITLEDYALASKEEMKDCILKLQRYSSEKYVNELLRHLEKGELNFISQKLMTDYYDALYQKSISKYEFANEIYYESIEEGVEKIISVLNKFGIYNIEKKL